MEFESLVNAASPEIKKLFLDLRALIFSVMPHAIEEVDVKANLVGYMLAPGYKGTVLTLIIASKWVTMGFSHGAALPDPQGLLTGSGKVHKLIRFTEKSERNSPALRQLMIEAVNAAQLRLKGNA